MPQMRPGNHSEAHILLGNTSCSCNRCQRCFPTRQTLVDHLETCLRCRTCLKRFQTLEESHDHTCGDKLCLLYTSATDPSTTLVVVDVSKDRISEECFSTIALPFRIAYPGFGSLGMKCYFFGGDNCKGEKPDRMGLWLPRDVYVCDLSCKKLSWKNGPKLHGGKPSPIVVTVNGKLYALAGGSNRWDGEEKLESLFEVFDPMHGSWRVLPEPPFIKMYEKGLTNYPKFQGHTVVGSIIYLKIGKIDDPDLFSFNVDTEKWDGHVGGGYESFSSAGSDELILHNLRYCTWRCRADVVNYLMFQTSGDMLDKLNVFAYDLTSNIKDHYDSISNDVEIFEEDQVGPERDHAELNREDQFGPESILSEIVKEKNNNKKKSLAGSKSDSPEDLSIECAGHLQTSGDYDLIFDTRDCNDDSRSNHSEITKETKKKNKKKTTVGSKSNSPKEIVSSKIVKDKVASRNKYDILVDCNDDSERNHSKMIKGKKKSYGNETIRGSESNSPEKIFGSKIGKNKVVRPNIFDMLDIDEKEYDLVKNDRVVTVPVYGLTSIDRDIPPRARDLSFVTHLRENLYSLVSYHTFVTDDYRREEHVNVCVFEASFIELSDRGIGTRGRFVSANNVREVKWVGSCLGKFIRWCKVPNDGCQSQFRRPQMQYGKMLAPYHDNVAGRVVHEKDTSQYLRVVDGNFI